MATQISLADLRSEVRTRGEFRSQYITDAELNTYINSSIAAYEDLISSSDPSYFLTQTVVDINNGEWVSDLPSDFFKMVGVAAQVVTGDGYQTLEQFNWEERWDHQYDSAIENTRWHVRGSYIHWNPKPAFSGTALIEYIPNHTTLSSDGDLLSSENNWHEWVILDVLIKCCAKEETDPSIYMAQQKKTEERIMKYVKRALVAPQTPTGSSLTLKQLQLMARNRGGWTREAVTDGQLTAFLNSSISALRDLISTYDPTYFVTHSNIVFTQGQTEQALPSDFFKVVGVKFGIGAQFVVDGPDIPADGYYYLEQFNWPERWDGYDATDYVHRYHVRGSNLYLHPQVLDSQITLDVEYIPTFSGLSAATDTTTLFNNWQEWVLLDVAIKVCAVTGTDPKLYAAQLQKVEKRIIEFDLQDIAQPTTPNNETNLQNLRLSIRARGNWAKEVINDSQLTAWINSSISSFVDLIAVHEPHFYLQRTDISVVSGTREYDLPSDFYKLHGVSVRDQTKQDGYSILERFQWDERNDYSYVSEIWNTRYMIMGQQIHFQPTPGWSDSVRLEYIPLPTALTKPTDTFIFYNNWQEWVILDVCLKVCGLLGTDPQLFAMELAKTEKRIVGFAEIDIGKPKTVTDVKRYGKYDPRFLWRRGK